MITDAARERASAIESAVITALRHPLPTTEISPSPFL